MNYFYQASPQGQGSPKQHVPIDVRSPHVTPELNNELQFNVGNMWEKLPCIYMH